MNVSLFFSLLAGIDAAAGIQGYLVSLDEIHFGKDYEKIEFLTVGYFHDLSEFEVYFDVLKGVLCFAFCFELEISQMTITIRMLIILGNLQISMLILTNFRKIYALNSSRRVTVF